MPVVQQISQGRLELSVELLNVGVLIDVQVEEMAKDVVVLFKLERSIALVQGFEHLSRREGGRRKRGADFENL